MLFNLAELQGECTKVLHISPSETLSVVQSLYEKKLTTYPRTDARVLSSAIAGEIKKNLSGLKNGDFSAYAEEIESRHYSLGNKYVDDSKITDHYAIIPTGKTVKELSGLEKSIYEMIVRRFLAVFILRLNLKWLDLKQKQIMNYLLVPTRLFQKLDILMC